MRSALLNQPIQVQALGGTGTDEYGNATPAALGSPVTEYGYLEQKDTTEFQDDRQTVVSRWTVYLPAGSTITATGYVTVGAQRFQVDGEPWHVYNPRTRRVDHVEAKLTEVT